MSERSRDRRVAALGKAGVSFIVLWGVCLTVYAALWLVDFSSLSHNPLALVRDPASIDALLSFSEVTVGILGIAITVVAIIVELAATRYTPRITELFLNDTVNAGVMSFFVVTSVLIVWVNLSLSHPEVEFPSNMAMAATLLMSTSLLAILPYFAYVFDFLSPTTIIQRIQFNGSRAFAQLVVYRGRLERSREEVLTAVEQLGDIGLNSVDKKDKPLTIASLNALSEMAHDHVRAKPQLPDAWFDSSPLLGVDQDFVAFHREIVQALTERRTWVEMKILRQYQAVFGESLNKLRDVNHLIAINTRRLGRYALEHSDIEVTALCIKFLNTYLRAALNARDLRTAYNLLNEYRLLAEDALRAEQHEMVVELAQRIKFYGQVAFGFHMGFILETAAYDLCALLELAAAREAPCHDQLLTIFLDVDREPEGGKIQEQALRGVRMSQIRLATHYLVTDQHGPARRIFEDMKEEPVARLRSIRMAIEAVEAAEFWEVSDRGIDFWWLPPDRRATLDTFFGWFEQL